MAKKQTTELSLKRHFTTLGRDAYDSSSLAED